MLYREIIAVCSEIHTKYVNTLCGQNVELLNVKMVVHIVTTGGTCNDHCVFNLLISLASQNKCRSFPPFTISNVLSVRMKQGVELLFR